jgi:hypothetical protein
MTSLEKIFNAVRDASSAHRKQSGDDFDGLKFWKPIKNTLKKFDKYEGTYKKINKTITNKIMNFPEFIINGKGEQIIIEPNHFLIQQVRLPIKYECTIRKIVQLGLNIGQWTGLPNKELWKEIKYPTKYKLNKLRTYVSKREIKRLSKFITNEDMHEIMASIK